MKRTALARKTGLKKKSKSETALVKDAIQAELRRIAIERDGGCFLRNYPEAGACDSVLQYDHLHSRVNAASFADERLGVCVCRRHHIFWKPQYPDIYMQCARDFIGPERSTILDRVQRDHRPHRKTLSDWQKELAYLRGVVQFSL